MPYLLQPNKNEMTVPSGEREAFTSREVAIMQSLGKLRYFINAKNYSTTGNTSHLRIYPEQTPTLSGDLVQRIQTEVKVQHTSNDNAHLIEEIADNTFNTPEPRSVDSIMAELEDIYAEQEGTGEQ